MTYDLQADTGLWDRDALHSRLREVGMSRYHHKHPFHQHMNSGLLTPDQIRGWICNRFYYQQNIPIKDAAILSNCPLPEVRRVWPQRLIDQRHRPIRRVHRAHEVQVRRQPEIAPRIGQANGLLAVFQKV